jgi:N-acetylmuramic acid 6-phosphate etherase
MFLNKGKTMDINKITEQQNPMSSHIDEQPVLGILEIINREDIGVPLAVQKSLPQIKEFIDALIPRFKDNGRLFYVGSGTSGRLGVLDAAECPPTYSTDPEMVQGIIAGGNDALVRSIEGAEDYPEDGAQAVSDHNITTNDTVLGITASSSTPFVLGALEQAKEIGALTGLISCNKPPKLEYVDHMISMIVGPEIITGSTRMKAGTATKLVLNMITTTLMIKLNKTYGNLMVDLKASNKKLWDRGTRIISHLTGLDYDDSLQLLQSAKGEVKIAIVMNKTNCVYDVGVQLLKNVRGSLTKALSE